MGEVGGAVFASTLTTVAVFFPIVFVEGVAGQIFGDLALAVVFSLLASLAVALFVIPMLSSRDINRFFKGLSINKEFFLTILNFTNEEKVNKLLSENNKEKFGIKLKSGLKELFNTIQQFIFKILFTYGAYFLSTLKYGGLLILAILSPIFALLSKLRFIKFKISDKAVKFSKDSTVFGKFKFVKTIWPTFLVYNSLPYLYQKLQINFNWFTPKSWLKKIIYFLPLVLSILFQIIVFIFYINIEQFFRSFHTTMIPILIFLKTLFIILKLVLKAPSKYILIVFNWIYEKTEQIYPKLLNYSLNNRVAVLGTAAVLFVFSVFIIAPNLGSELIPEVHQGEFNVETVLPVGTPVEKTDERMLAVLDEFSQFEPHVSGSG